MVSACPNRGVEAFRETAPLIAQFTIGSFYKRLCLTHWFNMCFHAGSPLQ
jgi:hypothetical protein